jgi:dTDP-4-amino-4,6-dideoxygalactose transaminase
LRSASFPVAERIFQEILSLPLFPAISKLQIDFVVKEITANRKSRT